MTPLEREYHQRTPSPGSAVPTRERLSPVKLAAGALQIAHEGAGLREQHPRVDQTAVGEWTQALRHLRGLRKGRDGGWIIAAPLLEYAELAELLRRVQLIPERPVDRERLAQVVVCLGVVALPQSDAAEIAEEQRGLSGVARAPARSQPSPQGAAWLREVGPGPGDEAEAVVLTPYGRRVPDPLEDLLGAGE